MAMRCEEVQELLPAYLDGEAARQAEIDAHLAWCAECRRELAGYRSMVRSLAALRERGAHPTPQLVERLVALIPAPSLFDRVRFTIYDHPGWYAAASLAAAAVAALVLRHRARTRAREALA